MGPLECCCQPCFASCHSATARLGCCELVHGKPAPAEAHSPHMQRCNQRAAAQNSPQALMEACLPCSYQRNNSSAHQEGTAAAPTKTGAAAAAPTSICQDTRHMQHHMAQCRTHAHCLPSDWQASQHHSRMFFQGPAADLRYRGNWHAPNSTGHAQWRSPTTDTPL